MAEETTESSKPKEVKAMLCPPDPAFILKAEMGHIHCINFEMITRKNFIPFYIGTESGELSMWNLTTKKQYSKLTVGSPILNVLLTRTTLITQEKEGLIKMYQIELEGLSLMTTRVVTTRGFCKSIIADNFLVVPAEEGVDLYNMPSMTVAKSFNCIKDRIYGMLMCVTPVKTSFGLYILLVYETGDSVLWDVNSFSKMGRIKFKPQPIAATYEHMKNKGAVVGLCNQIQIFEVRSPKQKDMEVVYHVNCPCDSLTAIRTRPDGILFVVGGSDGTLRYFSWKTLKLLVVLTEHSAQITDIKFIPRLVINHKKFTMVASSADGTVSFWDIY